MLQTATIIISLATRCLQVEDKVFHVKPQLADRLLYQIQDTAATLRALENSRYGRCQCSTILTGKRVDCGRKLLNIARHLFV